MKTRGQRVHFEPRPAALASVPQTRTGREQEFADFVASNRNRLMRYARKLSFVGEDPEDLLQGALIRAWRALPGFRHECS